MTVQFTIALDLPTEVSRGFKQLNEVVRRHVIRQAIRSALIPARNALKAKLMSLPLNSKQSSGASMRALTSKYANSKRDPDRFYGIIGINRKIVEYFDPTDKSPVYKNAMMRQVNFGIRSGRLNEDGSPIYSRRWRPMEVRSTLRRRYGVSNISLRKRIPNKYWHLVERGFNATDSRGKYAGNRTRFFEGHHFVEKTFQETKSQVLNIFKHRVVELFRTAFLD